MLSSINIQNNISFKGIPIYNIKLKQKAANKTKEIVATFSKMDESDLNKVPKMIKEWDNSLFGTHILSRFLEKYDKPEMNDKDFFKYLQSTYMRYFKKPNTSTIRMTRSKFGPNFYMIELPNEKNPNKGIKAIAEVFEKDDYIYISHLQSASAIFNEKIKGAGTMILYGLCKLAEKNKQNSLQLTSNLIDWYCGKLGFSIDFAGDIFLPKRNFPDFQKKIEKIYNLNKDKLNIQ